MKNNKYSEQKEMPDDWWNHGINPIVGYNIPRNHEKQRVRNKFEYVPEDDYNPNED